MEITHAFLFKTILKQTHIYIYGTLFISYITDVLQLDPELKDCLNVSSQKFYILRCDCCDIDAETIYRAA